MPNANSKGPDELVHPCSIIWTFSLLLYVLQCPLILCTDNDGPDQPARIRACIVRKLHMALFVCCALLIKHFLSKCLTSNYFIYNICFYCI